MLEDYLQMLLRLADGAPDIFYQSSAFPIAFRSCMAALTLVQADIIFAGLDLFRSILTHACLDDDSSPPPKYLLYAAAIRSVLEKSGFELTGCLLTGLIGDFEEATVSAVVSIFRALTYHCSSQILSWLPAILQQLPTTSASNESKSQFLSEVTK